MRSMRLKWQGVCGAASAIALLFAALSGGCSSQCNASLCIGSASLSGSIVIPKGATGIDSRLCVGITCTEGSVDFAEVDAGIPCSPWEFRARVCLTKASDPETFDLSAVSPIRLSEMPHDLSIHLTLVDHASGEVLLDEKRTAKADVRGSDECQVCWSAGATL
jgi:hypothetical protein